MIRKFLRTHAFWLALALLILGQAAFLWPGVPAFKGVGLSLFVLAAVLLLFAVKPVPKRAPEEPALPWKVELLLFGIVLALAAVLRFWDLAHMPSGMHSDQGLIGWNALRVLNEGWIPFFDAYRQQVPEPLLFLGLAFWFKVFGTSYVSFHAFFAVVALAAFPFLYYVVRRLAGPRTALTALFLLAVMRWHLIYSRNGYPTIQVPVYLFAALAFLLFALKDPRKRLWAFLVTGLVVGVGLYTYQAFKIVPFFFAALLLLERARNAKAFSRMRGSVLAGAAVMVLVAAPLVLHMISSKSVGNRERDVCVFTAMASQKSLAPLWTNLKGTAQMFHRRGDLNPRHNLPGLPMLDGVTGVLFAAGLVLALRNFRRRRLDELAVTGLAFLALPSLLAADSSANSSRLLGVTPFVAMLAASALVRIYDRLQTLPPPWRGRLHPAFAVLFALVAFLNIHAYFVRQARNVECWKGPAIEATWIGRLIEKEADRAEFYVTPLYRDHHTVKFLSYGRRESVHPFEYPRDLASPVAPPKKDVLFVLEDHKQGVFEHLKRLYPKGVDERFKDPDGRTLLYVLRVPGDEARAAWGMRASFTGATGPAKVYDLGTQLPKGPFRASLEGTAWFGETGEYRFYTKGLGSADLRLGRRGVTWGVPIQMTRGFHKFRIFLNKGPGLARTEFYVIDPSGKTHRFDSPLYMTTLPLAKGLKGVYRDSKGIVSIQWDPQVHFTNKKDFPFRDFPPFSARWEGWLAVPTKGHYRFDILTSDAARLNVAGVEIPVGNAGSHAGVPLTPGSYPIVLDYMKDKGEDMVLHLLWKKPGQEKWEPIPQESFGLTD